MEPGDHTEVEEWRPIPGWDYSASNLGRVRREAGVVIRKDGRTHKVSQKILSPGVANGYKLVVLCRDGVCTSLRVHRLVMLAFEGPQIEGTDVRHLNGDRTDNRLSNLTYGTRSENEYDKVNHGTHQQASKERCKYGHLYKGSNLKRFPSRPNARVCVSCRHAGNQAKVGSDPETFKAVANEKYKTLGLE